MNQSSSTERVEVIIVDHEQRSIQSTIGAMDSGRYNIPTQIQPRWDDDSVWHIRKSAVVSSLLIYRMLIPLVSMFNGSYMIPHIYI